MAVEGEAKGFLHFFGAWVIAYLLWSFIVEPYVMPLFSGLMPSRVGTTLDQAQAA